MGIEQVINLLEIANGYLPTVEQEYQRLKKEVSVLESRKLEENRILHDLQTQTEDSKKILKLLRISYQEEENNMSQLQGERARLKRMVKLFKDNDEEYLKIKKTVRDEVRSVLSNDKGLLRLAFYSLILSMRKDPDKYISLIYYVNNSASYANQYYRQYFRDRKYSSQLNSYDSFIEALKSVLLKDADELYEQLLKEQTKSIISNYYFS
jgi:hypothetical protein